MRFLLIAALFILLLGSSSPAIANGTSISLALVFEGDNTNGLVTGLSASMAAKGFTLPDQALVNAVSKTLKFNNLLNLTRDEGRSLGLALGVDFFLLARLQVVERAGEGAQLYNQGYLALAFINTRTGALVYFDFIETQATHVNAVLTSVVMALNERAAEYTTKLRLAFEQQFQPPTLAAEDIAAIEVPPENSPAAAGFQLPLFTARRQPEYSEIARKMAISAVVDVVVVLRADGNIGNIEITRWAGFGLDEAVIAAVKELKFKPATINGKPIGCRAPIRYNFNYKK